MTTPQLAHLQQATDQLMWQAADAEQIRTHKEVLEQKGDNAAKDMQGDKMEGDQKERMGFEGTARGKYSLLPA